MGVQDVRLELPPRPDSGRKLRAEEAEQGHLRGPGGLHLRRHVARIGERLISTGRVPEVIDADAIELVMGGKTGGGRGHDSRLDSLVSQGDGQAKHERAGRVAEPTGERVSQKENFHCAISSRTSSTRNVVA
jgi:hypothetical protein